MQIRYSFVLNTPPLMPKSILLALVYQYAGNNLPTARTPPVSNSCGTKTPQRKLMPRPIMFDIAVMPLSLRSNCAIIIAMPAAAMIYTKLLRQASQNFTLSVLPQIIATIINKSHMLNTKMLAPRAVCLL